MTAKRILAGLLVLLMLVPVFCACNPDMPDTPDVPGSDSDTNPEDTTPPEDKGLVLDVTDFDGTALRIYGLSKDYAYGYYATDDIWIEADSSDPMESAVYKRVQDCINKYNFNIQYTTAYQTVSTSAVLNVKRLRRTVRNPDWDSGFFLFRPIKRLFISKTIEKDDGLDMKALEDVIKNLRAELDASVDGVFDENKKALKDAIDILISNIDQLEAEIREYADRISGIGMRITALSDNIETQTAFAEDMKVYRKLIEDIHKALDFDDQRDVHL